VQLRMPKWYKIEARELEDGKWKFYYEEGFDPAYYEAWKNSVEVMRRLVGIEVKLESDRVIVEMVDTRDQVLNFLAGEFFMASELGQMKLAEIFSMVMLKAAMEKSRDDTKAL